jgi:hypothetical protein
VLDNIPVCAATVYNLTFAYRSLATAPGCTGYATAVGYGTHGSDVQWAYPLSKTDGFQKASIPLRVTNGAAYNIYLLLDCGGLHPQGFAAIDFTQFELQAVRSLEAPGCPNHAAHLTDGGFETGALGPWRLFTYDNRTTAGLVSTPHSLRNSSYNLRVSFDPSPNTNATVTGDEGFNLYQTVPDLCLAYTYELSLDYRWTGPHLAQLTSSLTLSILNCDQWEIQPGNSGVWQTARFTCQVTNNGNSTFEASFGEGFGDGQAAYSAFTLDLDNIAFRLSPT